MYVLPDTATSPAAPEEVISSFILLHTTSANAKDDAKLMPQVLQKLVYECNASTAA